jgi:hypothetical protein
MQAYHEHRSPEKQTVRLLREAVLVQAEGDRMTESPIFDILRECFREERDSPTLVDLSPGTITNANAEVQRLRGMFRTTTDADERERITYDADAIIAALEDLLQLRLHKIYKWAYSDACAGEAMTHSGMMEVEKLHYTQMLDTSIEYLKQVKA